MVKKTILTLVMLLCVCGVSVATDSLVTRGYIAWNDSLDCWVQMFVDSASVDSAYIRALCNLVIESNSGTVYLHGIADSAAVAGNAIADDSTWYHLIVDTLYVGGYVGANTDRIIYFKDDTGWTKYLKWDDSDSAFIFNDDLFVTGDFKSDGTIYVNVNGNATEVSLIYFGGTNRSLRFDGAGEHWFELDDSLYISKYLEVADWIKADSLQGKLHVTNLYVGSQSTGDLIYASSGSAWTRLALGDSGKALMSTGTGMTWETISGGVVPDSALYAYAAGTADTALLALDSDSLGGIVASSFVTLTDTVTYADTTFHAVHSFDSDSLGGSPSDSFVVLADIESSWTSIIVDEIHVGKDTVGDAFIYFTVPGTDEYVKWDSAASRFEFSDNVCSDDYVEADSFVGSLDIGHLFSTNQVKGDLLWYSGSAWSLIHPVATSGYILKTDGDSTYTWGQLSALMIEDSSINSIHIIDGQVWHQDLAASCVDSYNVLDGTITPEDCTNEFAILAENESVSGTWQFYQNSIELNSDWSSGDEDCFVFFNSPDHEIRYDYGDTLFYINDDLRIGGSLTFGIPGRNVGTESIIVESLFVDFVRCSSYVWADSLSGKLHTSNLYNGGQVKGDLLWYSGTSWDLIHPTADVGYVLHADGDSTYTWGADASDSSFEFLAVGNDAVIQPDSIAALKIDYSFTDHLNGHYGLQAIIDPRISAATDSTFYAIYGEVWSDLASTEHQNTAGLTAVKAIVDANPADAKYLLAAKGVDVSINNYGQGQLINAYGVYVNTIDNVSVAQGGEVNGAYGLWIANQDEGNNANYAIYTGTGANRLGDDLTVVGAVTCTTLALTPKDTAAATEGMIYYESEDDKVYVRTSAGWVDMTASGSSDGSIEDLNDVNAFTQVKGDLLWYTGTGWDIIHPVADADYVLHTDGDSTYTWEADIAGGSSDSSWQSITTNTINFNTTDGSIAHVTTGSDTFKVSDYTRVAGSVASDSNIYVDANDNQDDDIIYFSGTDESFMWDESDSRFELTDDLNASIITGSAVKSTGHIYANSDGTPSQDVVVYFSGTDEYIGWSGTDSRFVFTDETYVQEYVNASDSANAVYGLYVTVDDSSGMGFNKTDNLVGIYTYMPLNIDSAKTCESAIGTFGGIIAAGKGTITKAIGVSGSVLENFLLGEGDIDTAVGVLGGALFGDVNYGVWSSGTCRVDNLLQLTPYSTRAACSTAVAAGANGTLGNWDATGTAGTFIKTSNGVKVYWSTTW